MTLRKESFVLRTQSLHRDGANSTVEDFIYCFVLDQSEYIYVPFMCACAIVIGYASSLITNSEWAMNQIQSASILGTMYVLYMDA